jgi:signal transduction histidine kinase/CheY-like chemotaxis protein
MTARRTTDGAESSGGTPPAPGDVLDTVSVPAPFRQIFLRAQDYVRRYFSDRVEDPNHSTITISGERYILVRAAAMSVEFFDLVTKLYRDRGPTEAHRVASNMLFDLAHSIGRGDARNFHERMHVTDPIEKLSAGPIHFSFAGWAYVDIDPRSAPSPDENYFLLYDHPFSFESNAWRTSGRVAEFPVCVMNAGYSSGWCEESFGVPLVAVEVACQAAGDERCRFIMAPPSRIEEHLERYFATEATSAERARWQGRASNVAVPEFFQRKRMEDALRDANTMLERRVRERTAELAAANALLQAEIAKREREQEERRRLEGQLQQAQKLESLGVLAGGIAHDFNNLLVGVLGNAGIALDGLPAESPLRPTVESIETAALRAAELTRQMLAYSGRGQFVVGPVDLSQLVEEMSGLLQSVISKKARVQLQCAPELPPVEADGTQLRQVVMNLITNASDALGDENGDIVVRTGVIRRSREDLAATWVDDNLPAGDYVFLEVGDTGSGMDAQTRARMFDPFFTTKFTGRGLGMAAVLGIVRGHRGAIDVQSTRGLGTRVTVYFPRAMVREAPVRPPDAAAVPAAEIARRATILVADDDPGVVSVMRRILESAGLGVVIARDGQEAVDIFVAHSARISAVLLDLTMPRASGEEALRQIHALRRDVPVILMSGYTEQDAVDRVPANEIAGFIQKPFRPVDVLSAVNSALGPSPTVG